LGEIENLPVESHSIDLIISNCVINLSNQKEQVFKEAFRVAKPNGRIMISDIILLNDLPDYVRNSVEGHIACLAGAVRKEHYINAISKAGFENISIDKEAPFPIELMLNDPIAEKIVRDNNLTEKEIKDIANSIASVSISAKKPNCEI
jgi:arsenite methyltransferase